MHFHNILSDDQNTKNSHCQALKTNAKSACAEHCQAQPTSVRYTSMRRKVIATQTYPQAVYYYLVYIHKDDMYHSRCQMKIVIHPNQNTSSHCRDLFITVNVQRITPSIHNVLLLSFIDLMWCLLLRVQCNKNICFKTLQPN